MDFKTSEERDTYYRKHAEYFTVVCFRGVGNYERHECQNLPDAEKLGYVLARDSGRVFGIYAVIGNSDAFVKLVKPDAKRPERS